MSYLVARLLDEYYECIENFQQLGEAEYKAIARELDVSVKDLKASLFEAVLLLNDDKEGI